MMDILRVILAETVHSSVGFAICYSSKTAKYLYEE